jgi:hypothetical protein
MKFNLILVIVIIWSAQTMAGSACLIRKKSDRAIWFIEQNGSSVSVDFSKMQGALDRLKQLRSDGVCQQLIGDAVTCAIKKGEGQNQWFVTLGGVSISNIYTSMDSAIEDFQNLLKQNACGPYVQHGCEIKKQPNSNSWQILQDGSAVSTNYTTFERVMRELAEYKQHKICREAPESTCQLKKKNDVDNWFVEQNGLELSRLFTSFSTATTFFNDLIANKACYLPANVLCELKKKDNSNSWFVEVGGNKISADFTNINSAITKLNSLKDNHVCQQIVKKPCRIVKNEGDSWKITLGGENIKSSNVTSMGSAIDEFKAFLAKNICEDSRYTSTCKIKKIDNQQSWFLEQDGQALSRQFTNLSSAEDLLKDLYTSHACNEQLQVGCQVTKSANSNSWYVTQDGQQLSTVYSTMDAASTQFRRLYSENICRRGVCEIRQDRFGRVAVVRGEVGLNSNDNLAEAVTQFNELMASNTCDLAFDAKICNIYNRNGHYYLVDGPRIIGSSDNYTELRTQRTQLQTLGYCQVVDPVDFLSATDDGSYTLDRPRPNIVFEYFEGHPVPETETSGAPR